MVKKVAPNNGDGSLSVGSGKRLDPVRRQTETAAGLR